VVNSGEPAAAAVILTVFMVPVVGFGLWSLLYVVLTTGGATGTVQGASVPVSEEDAPELWKRVAELASRVGTDR
jgi:Na+-transporting NADH:ubiquinone oxidoreductase subunit NqrC